jgi:hypothetical protein
MKLIMSKKIHGMSKNLQELESFTQFHPPNNNNLSSIILNKNCTVYKKRTSTKKMELNGKYKRLSVEGTTEEFKSVRECEYTIIRLHSSQ